MTVEVTLTCGAFDAPALVHAAEGVEAANMLGVWRLAVEVDTFPDVLALRRQLASLIIEDKFQGLQRTVAGQLATAKWVGGTGNTHRLELTLVPLEGTLSHAEGYRVFRRKTAPQVVQDVLQSFGVPTTRYVLSLSGTFTPRDYTVQYGESAWGFIERLLAEEAISYWFDQTDDGPVCVFCDDLGLVPGVEGDAPLPFLGHRATTDERGFSTMSRTCRRAFRGAHLLAYSPRHPDLAVDGRAGDTREEWFDYPTRAPEGRAPAFAQLQLEQLRRTTQVVTATGNSSRVQVGRRLTVESGDDKLAGDYFIDRVRHQYRRRGSEAGAGGDYLAQVELIPWSLPLRPPLPLRRRMGALELGITTGPAGEEIHVDDFGSVTLRFPWDRSGVSDHESSCFSRTIQAALGGSMILPRVGWEVPVFYHDGDPDCPLVFQRLYNGATPLPYSLPGANATSGLKSASTPGGGGAHELRLGDTAGSQEFYLHATRDQTATVGGSASTKVGTDEKLEVGLSSHLAVGGSQTAAIGANQRTSVSGDTIVAIDGARTETVAAADTYKITGNRALAASGLYMEMVGGFYGIQCNKYSTAVTVGGYTQLVGAASTQTAGLGVSESVAGARALRVGAVETMLLRSSYEESTGWSSKTATVGVVKRKAGGKMSLEHKGTASVKAGGVVSIKAGSRFSVLAPKITIKASGGLVAGTLKMKGGTFDISGGTTSITGDTKRKGVTKQG